jgi:DNA processing protein
MIIKKLTLTSPDFPERLREINSPPNLLYHAGAPLNELLKRPAVAIVGTRKISPYGQQVTWEFAGHLAEQGLVIVSGLALGLDTLAHKAALECGGLTIAVLPCPLEKIVPMTNRRLAERILDNGGALVSEYPEDEWPKRQYFIARNRIVSGLADAVLIPEAGEKSGALYTARFGLEQGRNILAVPGSINAVGSIGTNSLIKNSKAGAVTAPVDVLNALGLKHHTAKAKHITGRNVNEQTVLDLMMRGVTDGRRLLEESRLEISQFNQVLTMLEIASKIYPLGANHWSLV